MAFSTALETVQQCSAGMSNITDQISYSKSMPHDLQLSLYYCPKDVNMVVITHSTVMRSLKNRKIPHLSQSFWNRVTSFDNITAQVVTWTQLQQHEIYLPDLRWSELNVPLKYKKLVKRVRAQEQEKLIQAFAQTWVKMRKISAGTIT